MNTQTFTGTLIVKICGGCGMTYGVEESFDQRRRDDHGTFYCPAGCARHYTGKSEAEKLRDELNSAAIRERSLRTTLTHTRDQLQATEYQRRAQKANNTKLRKRIAAGVCPCCQRTFQDVARHMKGQHPAYLADGARQDARGAE